MSSVQKRNNFTVFLCYMKLLINPTWPAYLSMKQIKDIQALEVNGSLSPTTAEALFRHPEKWNETIEQLKAK